MKRNIQFILFVFFTLCLSQAAAQKRPYSGTINIEPVRFEQHGDFLHIEINFITDGMKVKSVRSVNFTPRLISSSDTCNLPEVSFKGRNEFLAYERTLAISAKKNADLKKPYAVQRGYGIRNDTLRYLYAIPYEPWMADARLDIRSEECGCGETVFMNMQTVTDKVVLERLLTPYVAVPHLTYVEPVTEKVKNREIQVECFLDFEVNKVDIRPEYMNNPVELTKIHTAIDDLKSDKSIEVQRLEIIGYASPEGTLAVNKRLSEGRAMALRRYLTARYDFPRNLYHIVFGGENWEGLVKALHTIDMDYKDEVLEIIKNTSVEEGRETKLMRLHGGVPYRYLLKNIFPGLRVAICKVNYDIRNFSMDEAKDMIKKRPQNLSLNELFLVADSYPKGSQEFIEVFETAVRLYPEDEVANINAASACLLRGDTLSAERYLKKVKSNKYLPEYNNAVGVLALLKGDYEQAEKHLRTAVKLGVAIAEENLKELAEKKANAIEIESRRGNR
ncbi:DUF3868 domain-containing protein [Bacteroides clarus]|jgi:tetratricopeptide (TPR) repeat protein|uniref:DUF3868 domain-containing protein n=1 Tax=Bacteroides clarus TaxID=626929 RepID=A0A412Y5T9_9BACE|nr:DUF3868 domain-containing protein [Bacteroides clarus]RGV35549.1 DUF3868 domain-containing protein [Bacteroides clarus]RGV52789.1 DUF3868 domain-containing protein [Bacteroides clarus]